MIATWPKGHRVIEPSCHRVIVVVALSVQRASNARSISSLPGNSSWLSPTKTCSYHPRLVDHEERRSRDVPRVHAHPVPDPIALGHLTRLVDEDMEGQPRLLDIAAHHVRVLRDNRDHRHAARRVVGRPFCQFTEPAATIGSPGPSMKGQQHRPAREILRQRPLVTTIGRQREIRRRVAGFESDGVGQHFVASRVQGPGSGVRSPESGVQNSVTSTTVPASTASTSAGISKYPSECARLVISPDPLNTGTAVVPSTRTG